MVARFYLWFVALMLAPPLSQANSQVCAACHAKIAQTYRQTGMGRSFSPLNAQNIGEAAFYHPPSDSYFTIERRQGLYYQRRHQLNAAGKTIITMELRVDYVMGSGNHARTYLHRADNGQIVELPLGWYAEKGGYWAMNPGYDRPDHEGFRRPITYDCMFCHNAYPKTPATAQEPFALPVYEAPLPEGIDCQRCHGDGAKHIKLAGANGTQPAEIRAAILNPSRLSADRQMDLCMSCHLETTSFPLPNAIQKLGRAPFSFQPGERLADFILNFDHAPGAGRDDKFEIVSSAYRLRRSACFLKSAGKLTCTTCHNPHDAPRGQGAVDRYDAVCRQCHGDPFQSIVRAGKHTPDRDCASCHMPKRRTEDVVHAVVTDHLIQRNKPGGDLLAEMAERHESGPAAYRGPVVPYYPAELGSTPEDQLYLALAQVKQASNLKAGIAQLSAATVKHAPTRADWYLELAGALDQDRQFDKALAMYREAAKRSPGAAYLQQRLGTALRRAGKLKEAVDVLTRASTLDPARPVTWHELGLAYRAQDRPWDAIAAIEKAIQRDSSFPEAHNNLGILRLAQGDPAGAEANFREAVRIKPGYADAHGNLAGLLERNTNFAEAKQEYLTSLTLRPLDAVTRYNYAMLLGRGGDYAEARRQLERSLQADPTFAASHELLGELMLAMDEAPAAIPHFRESLKLQPDLGRSRLGLGAALAATGNREEAMTHLQRAAQDPDASIRERARGILTGLANRRK